MSKFQLKISTYIGTDIAEHYYGTILIPDDRPEDPEGDYRHVTLRHNSDLGRGTSRFWSQKDVVAAAKKWFLKSDCVQPGDKLTVWKGYLNPDLQYGDESPIGY